LLALQVKVTVEEVRVDPGFGLNITGGTGKAPAATFKKAKDTNNAIRGVFMLLVVSNVCFSLGGHCADPPHQGSPRTDRDEQTEETKNNGARCDFRHWRNTGCRRPLLKSAVSLACEIEADVFTGGRNLYGFLLLQLLYKLNL